MRVLKPLTLARRRQSCAHAVLSPRPAAPPPPPHEAELYDLREERRSFAERQDALPPRRDA